MNRKLEELYCQLTTSVRASKISEEKASNLYAKYIDFVNRSVENQSTLLDVGCGSAWSSYMFSKQGYKVVGIDLNPEAFECPKIPNLTLVTGSAINLPFEDSSFEVVTCYQAIEHILEPQKALMEMIRVLKPGGTLCIVGPNLLSLGQFFRAVTIYVWKKRSLKNIFWRTPDMPRHPWGNTLPEVLFSFPAKLGLLSAKILNPTVTFTMREPDTTPPFHADNDACYLCNPIDFIKFLPTQNCTVFQNGFYGRPKWTALISSGTFIAARKLT